MPLPHFRRSLGAHTLTVLRAPMITDPVDNTQSRDWQHPTSTPITGCEVQPFLLSSRLEVEVDTLREFSRTLYRVWAPGAADIQYTDRIVWRGTTYEVVAEPGLWSYGDATPSHTNFLMGLRSG